MAGALTVEQGRALKRIANDLLVQAEATVVMLTDIGGNMIAQVPPRDDPNLPTMAALAAGAFSATRAVASLTGETGFRSVSHEGEQTSLFVQSLADEYLLVIVYQKTTTLGLVKLYARRAGEEASEVLAAVREQTAAAVAPDTLFVMSEAQSDIFANAETAPVGHAL